MKNLILQHFDGELRELDKLSIENIKKYAELVSVDYKLITGRPFRKHLTSPCQKVIVIDEQFDEWDNVLMLDIDMFVPKNMTENVFELTGIGLYGDVQKSLHRKIVESYPMICSSQSPYWGGAIYKLTREQRQKLRQGLNENDLWMNSFNKSYHFEDEGIMHVLAYRANMKEKNAYLDKKWCQCSFLPNPEKAGFIHVRTKVTPTGPKREKIENYKALVEKGIL
jgi:hypothetical protein